MKEFDSPSSEESAVTERNQLLDARLNDPNRPLPNIRMVEVNQYVLEDLFFEKGGDLRIGDSSVESSFFVVLSPDRRNVGYVVIKKPEPKEGQKQFFYIGDIGILEGGEGYGPATYLEIMKSLPKDTGLRTEGVLSSDALKVWNNFVDKGIAHPSDKGGAPTSFETNF